MLTNDTRWYIATVVTIADPDKRRRIQARGPMETEEAVPTEQLPWLQPFMISKDYFELPEVGESVLVLQFQDLRVWVELPDMASWSEFSEEDYARAWLLTHKDVYKALYTDSAGFDILYVGNIKVKTDNTETVLTEDSATITYNTVKLETNGEQFKLTVGDVVIDTDGKLLSIKNGQTDLLTLLNDLQAALQAHTHPTGTGPSGPPINIADFIKNQQDYAKLLM